MAILVMLSSASIGLAARPTTRPTLEQLRPHSSGPVMIAPTRAAEAKIDSNANHYLYAQPAPCWYWGYGWCGYYGWNWVRFVY